MAKTKENKKKSWQENIGLYIFVGILIIFAGGLLLNVINPERKEPKVNIKDSKMEKSPVIVDSPGTLVAENIVVNSRDEFISLNIDLRRKLEGDLKALLTKYKTFKLMVGINIETGNSNRIRIRDELIEILCSAGIDAKVGAVTQIFSQRKIVPIRISCHPNCPQEVFYFAKDLAVSFSGMFNNEIPCDKGWILQQEKEVRIHLNGTPRFNPNGTIVFD